MRAGTFLLLGLLLAPLALAGCVPSPPSGSLATTLTVQKTADGPLAMQNGIPVPSFDFQPRPRIDLSGSWRVERVALDTSLSLTDRSESLAAIEREASGRQLPSYDDSGWPMVAVPGSFDPPPDRSGGGAWYRRTFPIPASWEGLAITLKFAAVNYVADVWMNGHWLGEHEGGSTPFAFPVERVARPGAANVLAVRVDVPTWGTRMDVVPWGLADWWDFGGIVQPVWLEASQPLAAARADVIPGKDDITVSVVIQDRGATAAGGDLVLTVLPTVIDAANLLDPDPRALVRAGVAPIASRGVPLPPMPPGGVGRIVTVIPLPHARRWAIGAPALYLLRVTVRSGDGSSDELDETFGLRQISVDPSAPRILLDGVPVTFAGVALQDQQLVLNAAGHPVTARPLTAPAAALAALRQAQEVGATLLRTGETPAEPSVLMLADRLGLAIWEEIPLDHEPTRALQLAMGRGVPQQMLQEMALRDMDHPSVLFYGLTNESAGGAAQATALKQLRDAVDQLDRTRLLGQADYAFEPAEWTSNGLDVAGYTFYYGVFYGTDPSGGTRDALVAAHRRYPNKPIMILEFGTWADPPDGPARQVRIMTETGGQLAARATNHRGGYVGAMVWWTLNDYFTMQPSLTLERFGLFAPDGSPRPVVSAAKSLFASLTRPGAVPAPDDGAVAPAATPPASTSYADPGRLFDYLAFGLGFAVLVAAGALVLVLRPRQPRRDPGADPR
ncbi:MAG: sugar-binding domain-containing protein [Candidatus Limnocylindrales bacterium]